MKSVLCLITLILTAELFISSANRVTLYTIKGTVMQTADYCGGADPGEEVLAEMRKPKPFPSKKLFIKPGERNSLKGKIIYKVTADSLGQFTLKLPAGEYCIMEEYKTKKLIIPASSKNSSVDSTCLKNEWRNCDYMLRVTDSDINNITINYHLHCPWTNPCIGYYGPMPR